MMNWPAILAKVHVSIHSFSKFIMGVKLVIIVKLNITKTLKYLHKASGFVQIFQGFWVGNCVRVFQRVNPDRVGTVVTKCFVPTELSVYK